MEKVGAERPDVKKKKKKVVRAKLAAYLEQLRLQVEPLVERKLLEQVGESGKVQQGGRDLRTGRKKPFKQRCRG